MVYYTAKGDAVYAICLAWPEGTLKLGSPTATPQTQVRLLGYPEPLKWGAPGKGLEIQVPPISPTRIPCRCAWVFKLTGLKAP